LALLLTLSIAQGATHKHPKAPVDSLLKECHGANALPSPNCGHTPTPAFAKDGRLWLAFVQNGHVYVAHSSDLGQTFAPPVVVNRVPEAIYSDGENRPKLALGPQGDIYVSWTHKSQGRYAGQVRFARSVDRAKSFDTPLTVNDDRAPISHRFDSMAVDGQGRIYVLWIDKRDLAAAKAVGREYAGAALYYAVSQDRGSSFAFNRKVADHSCECCRIAVAVDKDDGVVAVWRHVYPGSIRDHAIARLGTEQPTPRDLPVRATFDDWQMDGCPHHGPDLSLGGKGQVHLAWFTQGPKQQGLMYGRFNMASQSLEIQHSLDTSSAAARPQVLGVPGRLYTAWKSFDGTQTTLLWRVSQDDGETWSPPQVLALTADGSDYPILLRDKDQVFLSWHTRAEGYRLLAIPFNKPDPDNAPD